MCWAGIGGREGRGNGRGGSIVWLPAWPLLVAFLWLPLYVLGGALHNITRMTSLELSSSMEKTKIVRIFPIEIPEVKGDHGKGLMILMNLHDLTANSTARATAEKTILF